ncbi:hypothetical protein A2372_04210 [Candidatus Wolfebacteria bacterium RIFOXYB1_FULL_54_12]|uniref:Uncharacterized protein n=1 Tax=Candidatus Wolfebacteria bacterium RIFOXYB1_FULL_54_12 TaxID=1802559 RepID=A0A1F8DVH8_9BACT|nr:MAG: hypothetical protein A2372_04210 [Candidatus Wolfebacteria bacterium RIFOXYB1_FULL_54_12]
MTYDDSDKFSSYQHGEGHTGIGQPIKFTCPIGGSAQVAEFVRTHVRTIEESATKRVLIGHGIYGSYSRYDIVQHRYHGVGNHGNGGAYLEVLEIRSSPEGHWGVVTHRYTEKEGSVFIEWETLGAALSAFAEVGYGTAEKHEAHPGFKRWVLCGKLTPWFYAIGNEELVGDFAFPRGMQDDPVYRLGKKFVVFDKEEPPHIKTCMGARFFSKQRSINPRSCGGDDKPYCYRHVYWDDGSVWCEGVSMCKPPRPLEEGELWIAEAMDRFRELLAGKTAKVQVDLGDGNKFVGKFVKEDRVTPTAEGIYLIRVKIKGEDEAREGLVGFNPTTEDPDVVKYITRQFTAQGKEIEHIEIKERKRNRKGKKWAGVFPPL